MNTTFREQMSIDDINTGTNTQQSTSAAKNAASQEKAHEYKQRLAESVQTTSDSTDRNDTAPQSANRPKAASHSDFHRNSPQEQRNNNGSTNDNDNAARNAAPVHPYDKDAGDSIREHSAVTNDKEYGASVTDCCETAPVTAEPKRRQRKAQRDSTSPISDMQMLTPDDIMQALRLSRSTVYNMLKKGEIPSVKIGNMLRVNKSDFEHWLEKHTTAAHAV